MSRSPAFSIITPTYNRVATLDRAIRSVQRQTFTDYEHLIVDDASTDGTRQLVESIEDSRIRYLRFDRWQGANPARNAGIKVARAAWIVLLDSDDELLPHRLDAAQRRIRRYPDVELFVSSFQMRKHDRQSQATNPDAYLTGEQLEQALMSYALAIAGTSIIVRRSHVLRAGGFTPSLLRQQDRDVLLKLSRLGGARLSAEVDWIKHCSPDSISESPRGFVKSLDAMFAQHPQLAARYRELLGYQVSRYMLRAALNGSLREVWASWRVCRRSQQMGFGLVEMARDYVIGKRLRRRLVRELGQFSEATEDDSPWPSTIPMRAIAAGAAHTGTSFQRRAA